MSRYREGANNLEMFDMIARADTFVVGSGLIMGRLCLFVRITCVCVCVSSMCCTVMPRSCFGASIYL